MKKLIQINFIIYIKLQCSKDRKKERNENMLIFA